MGFLGYAITYFLIVILKVVLGQFRGVDEEKYLWCNTFRNRFGNAIDKYAKNITSRNNYLQGSSPMKCWNGNFLTEEVWMVLPEEELVMHK